MDSKPSNYKSVMCRYYISGNCSRINCSFAHSTEEINNSRKKNLNNYNKKENSYNDDYVTNNDNFPNLSNNKVITKKNNSNDTWINIAKKNITTGKLPVVEKLIGIKNDLEQNCEIAKSIEYKLNEMIKEIKDKIEDVDIILKEINEKNKSEEIINSKKNNSSSDIVILPKTIFSNYNINKDNVNDLSDNEEYDDDDY